MQDLLYRLESIPEDRYVLHGSPYKLSQILPHQTAADGIIPEYQEHAVYGTIYPPMAMLYAVIHDPRDCWGWKVDEDGVLVFRMLDTLPLTPKDGYIYVLPRASFTKIISPGSACLAYQEVPVIETIEVPAAAFRFLEMTGRLRLDD